jgi:hypothetical protein
MHKLSKRGPSFNTVLAAKKSVPTPMCEVGTLDALSRGGCREGKTGTKQPHLRLDGGTADENNVAACTIIMQANLVL